jgi:hypothetical protein
MTAFSRSPRLLKGALVQVDPLNPQRTLVLFQYNPDRVTRSLQVRSSNGETNSQEPMRLSGPPDETINIEIEIDATDQLETGVGSAGQVGIHPALAALELLVYPSAAQVITTEALARAGILEIIPPEAPLTLLVWGTLRIVPVHLTSYSITEEAFDPNLNPIRASVELSMRVLNYHNSGLVSPAGVAFMAHQVTKEALAAVQLANTADAALRSNRPSSGADDVGLVSIA